jgi:hypothetical protein
MAPPNTGHDALYGLALTLFGLGLDRLDVERMLHETARVMRSPAERTRDIPDALRNASSYIAGRRAAA